MQHQTLFSFKMFVECYLYRWNSTLVSFAYTKRKHNGFSLSLLFVQLSRKHLRYILFKFSAFYSRCIPTSTNGTTFKFS